jgi:hypothetical protein
VWVEEAARLFGGDVSPDGVQGLQGHWRSSNPGPPPDLDLKSQRVRGTTQEITLDSLS